MGLWSKVKKVAKKAAKAVKKVLEVVVDIATTIVNAVVETLESTVIAWVGGLIGAIIGGILTIPYFGRFINWILQIIKTIIWRLVGIVDFGLSLIGILPEKKMRICVIALKDSIDYFATEAEILNNLDNLIQVFKDEANVRVVSSAPFQYNTPFSSVGSSTASWIHFKKNESSVSALDVSCNSKAAKEDIGLTGGVLQSTILEECFYGNFRRLIGYGAPLVVFVLRKVEGKLGCSLGPLVDYVTTSGDGIKRDISLIAHECGHACGLAHCGDFSSGCDEGNKNNLMYPNAGRNTKLNRWQVAVLRNSRHVTSL